MIIVAEALVKYLISYESFLIYRHIIRINENYLFFLLLSDGIQEHVPNGDDVADGARQDEEMEDAVHVAPLVEAVERRSRDVADPLGDNPSDRQRTHVVDKRLERHEHAQAHGHETSCLEVAVLLEADEAGDGARYGAGPNEDEESPSPKTLTPQRHEGDGRIGTGDVPVDGGVVPPPHGFLPFAELRQGMIDCRSDIRAHHAEEIEDDTCPLPSVALAGAHHEENHPHHHADDDACGVRPSVDVFLSAGVIDAHSLFFVGGSGIGRCRSVSLPV